MIVMMRMRTIPKGGGDNQRNCSQEMVGVNSWRAFSRLTVQEFTLFIGNMTSAVYHDRQLGDDDD